MTRMRSTAIEKSATNDDNNDTDLDDLLFNDKTSKATTTTTTTTESTKGNTTISQTTRFHRSVFITLDSFIRNNENDLKKDDNLTTASNKNSQRNKNNTFANFNQMSFYPSPHRIGFLTLICSHCRLVLSTRPMAAVFLFVVVVASLVVTFNEIALRHKSVPIIDNDYTDVKSIYDLSVGLIDHWCLVGDDDSCACEDPLTPVDRKDSKRWKTAHERNKQMIKNATTTTTGNVDPSITSPSSKDIDVVFLGESLVEEWSHQKEDDENNSTKFGDNAGKYFQRHFSKEHNATFEGLALGVAGDAAPNVLWRLLHGEMTDDLKPRVWWIILGRSDLVLRQCSEEVVLLGILRVVEEIRTKRPNAKIVVNGLLPMSNSNEGRLFMRDWHPDDGKNNNRPLGMQKKPTKPPTRRSHLLGLLARNRLSPFWPSIVAINQQLELFCDKHDHMTYFDAARRVFVETTSRGNFVKKNLMDEFHSGHPSKKGHREWQRAINNQLKDMLTTTTTKTLEDTKEKKKKKKESPTEEKSESKG